MAPSDEAQQQNEGSRVARPEPLLFLLFMCHVNITLANHQSHDFSSLPPHIDTTSGASKAPMSPFSLDKHTQDLRHPANAPPARVKQAVGTDPSARIGAPSVGFCAGWRTCCGTTRALSLGFDRRSRLGSAHQLWDLTPRFLIRDNDAKFGPQFARVAAGSRIEVLRTPVRAPRANAVCERFLGSVRRECLDHLLILHERQLYRVLRAYCAYFNTARPHQGLGQAIPEMTGHLGTRHAAGPVVSLPILGGLHHDYRRAA